MKYIKKITNKQILYIMTLLILIGVPLIKLLGFYLQKYNVISNYNILNTNYILYFTIPFQVYLYYKRNKVSNNKSNLIDLLINILILTTITSSFMALDPKIAFFGNQFRKESFFVILTYYLLILNWKNYQEEKDIKNLIKIIIVIATINCLYSILQQYTNLTFILRYTPNNEMTSGLTFNPNFLATLVVTSLSILISSFVINKNNKIIFLIILFILSLINTNSLGPFLTLIIILILLPIYLLLIKKLNIKRYLIILLIIVLTTAGTILVNKTIFKITTCELCDTYENVFKSNKQEIIDTHQSKTSEKPSETPPQNRTNTGEYDITNGRLDIWKKAIAIFKEHPLLGIGYDNFYLAYHDGKYYKIEFIIDEQGNQQAIKRYFDIVDNPHNVYLHVLVSTGLLGFIPYMILLLLAFIICIKKKNIILLSAFVAYSIQAFANINVTQVAPIYFIIIGLILSQTKELAK